MRRRLALVGTLIALASAAALVAASLHPLSAPGVSPRLALASNKLRIVNSRDGQALITAVNAAPGGRNRNMTAIRVVGADADVTLAASNVEDSNGPNHRPWQPALSQDLRIKVIHVIGPGVGAVAYDGPLASMGTIDLGAWPAGTTRWYRINAVFPDHGAPRSPVVGDNIFQGAATGFNLAWTATSS